MQKTSFLRWWLTLSVIITSSVVLYLMDIHTWVWHNDQTKLSFVILFIFYVATFYVGQQIFLEIKGSPNKLKDMEYIWFVCGALTALGLIGTVYGFITMLGESFVQFDITDMNNTKQVIKDMALGMSTALVTTLFGLSTSLTLQFQLMNIKNEKV